MEEDFYHEYCELLENRYNGLIGVYIYKGECLNCGKDYTTAIPNGLNAKEFLSKIKCGNCNVNLNGL